MGDGESDQQEGSKQSGLLDDAQSEGLSTGSRQSSDEGRGREESDGESPAETPPPKQGSEEISEDEWRHISSYQGRINTLIEGDVRINGSAVFGGVFNDDSDTRLEGRLSDDEVDSILLNVVIEPGIAADLADQLESEGMLVICGPEGSGRRSAALSTLRRCRPDAAVIRLAPSSSYSDLAAHAFESGNLYLLNDQYDVDNEDPRDVSFNIKKLAEKLLENSAFLIVTRKSRPRTISTELSPSWLRKWWAPDAASVFEAHAKDASVSLTPSDQDTLEELLQQMDRPGDVAQLVRLLADGSSLDDALVEFSAVEEHQVIHWFANSDFGLRKLTLIIASAFMVDEHRLNVEHKAADLAQRLDPERTEIVSDGGLPKKRSDLWAELPIPTNEMNLPPLRFEQFRLRHAILSQLVDNYTGDIWQVVLGWATDLLETDRIEDGYCSSVGFAMADLDGIDSTLVSQQLEQWSMGERPHQIAAALAFQWMAVDAARSGSANSRAIEWTKSSNTRQAFCGSLALASQAGLTRPADSLNAQWELARRRPILRIAIARNIAELFGTIEDKHLRSKILQWFYYRYCKASKEDLRGLDFVERCIAETFHVRHVIANTESALRLHLESCEDDIDLVGLLWAKTVTSRKTRSLAIKAIARFFDRLDDNDETRRLAGALSIAISNHLSRAQNASLRSRLGDHRELEDSDADLSAMPGKIVLDVLTKKGRRK